ncbi:hypothetical protein F0562_021094 [Nyssa sinensis]|uniref:Uncharacterized protein n=1 Tax=Nyssa sinensis TaxID=561372 RepID=A0A5J5BQE4_9ASTE|nr:hypothetical protein F0562_021094 [Nyssa sinensis]
MEEQGRYRQMMFKKQKSGIDKLKATLSTLENPSAQLTNAVQNSPSKNEPGPGASRVDCRETKNDPINLTRASDEVSRELGEKQKAPENAQTCSETLSVFLGPKMLENSKEDLCLWSYNNLEKRSVIKRAVELFWYPLARICDNVNIGKDEQGANNEVSEYGKLEEDPNIEVVEENCLQWLCCFTSQCWKKNAGKMFPWIACLEAVTLEVQVTVEASSDMAKKHCTVQL